VDAGYFETLGTPIVRGRGFTEQDREGARRVAVVNETMARRYWPGGDATGHRIRLGEAGPSLDVVGVARDGKYGFIGEDPRPYFFLPLAQNYSSPITMIVRSAADPKVLAGMLEREVSALDPDLPAFGMMTLEEFRRRSLSALEAGAIYSVSFGLLALGLAAVGLYGVVSYAVGQRTREIGVRVALGAGRGDVLRMVLGGALRLGLAGVALGLGLAFGAAPLLASVLHGVSGRDPLVFGVAPAVLLAVVLLASLVPARRAARVEPRVALRSE
jgi:predicted permease